MLSDPLSDIFRLLDARSLMSVSLVAGGDWAIRFDAFGGIKFNAVARGACWLAVEGLEPIRLSAGDCFLLKGGRPFLLASALNVPPDAAGPIFARAEEGVARHGAGDDTFVIGGRLELDAADASLLLEVLPPVIHFRGPSDPAAAVRWLLTRLAAELTEVRPGKSLVCADLMQMMLIEALRAQLAAGEHAATGWFAALGDRQIGSVLQRLHADPSHPWTLDSLAAAAGMSRSSFAARFKTTVGLAPMDYLLRWRIRLASKWLRASKESVSSIALSLGYESESGFSTAFKRVTAQSPVQYRKSAGHQTEPILTDEAMP
ncbi:MAG TPA: AraC family transcriptional regulator [Devosiaceae bacterium]|nr:AraC family transcriptional regulator [Devosiaceae bacterium]